MDTPDPIPARHSNHREREIIDQVRLAGGACRIQFLAERLGVTEETIRRNIKSLEKDGHVRKVHGGVHLIGIQDEPTFQQRMGKNPSAKQTIAATVADMIHNGDSLFLDIGSTTAYIARALRNHKDLFVVTNSLSVASALASRNNNRIFFAGGELRAHDGGAFGAEAARFVLQFNVQYAVFSVAGIDAESGFMLFDLQEAELSRNVVSRAQTCIVAADSNKFGHRAPVILKDPSDFDILVTDKAPEQPINAMLQENGIDLVIAGR